MTRVRLAVFTIALALTLPASVIAQGTATPAKPKSTPQTQAQLQKEAKIKFDDASATALKEVPGGTVSKHELARKKGKLVYAFTIKVKDKSGSEKVDVDATTGEMVSHTHKAAGAAKKPSTTL